MRKGWDTRSLQICSKIQFIIIWDSIMRIRRLLETVARFLTSLTHSENGVRSLVVLQLAHAALGLVLGHLHKAKLSVKNADRNTAASSMRRNIGSSVWVFGRSEVQNEVTQECTCYLSRRLGSVFTRFASALEPSHARARRWTAVDRFTLFSW